MSCVVVGPGLGRDFVMQEVGRCVILSCRENEVPMVIDADGLWILNSYPDILKGYKNVMTMGGLTKSYPSPCRTLPIRRLLPFIASVWVFIFISGLFSPFYHYFIRQSLQLTCPLPLSFLFLVMVIYIILVVRMMIQYC